MLEGASYRQTVPKGILRAGHLSPRGWSLTHRKPTFTQQAFRHKTLGGRLHLIERLSWYHKHPERARILDPYALLRKSLLSR